MVTKSNHMMLEQKRKTTKTQRAQRNRRVICALCGESFFFNFIHLRRGDPDLKRFLLGHGGSAATFQ